MTDDAVDVDRALGANRLTVHEPHHLHMLLGDRADPTPIESAELRLDTRDGMVSITARGGTVRVSMVADDRDGDDDGDADADADADTDTGTDADGTDDADTDTDTGSEGGR